MRLLAATGLMATLVACGPAQESIAPLPRRVGPSPFAKSEPGPPKGLVATRFATVTDVFGPFIERQEDGALVVWAASQAGARSWSTLALTDRGEPKGEPRALSVAPQEIGLVALRSLTHGGAPAGFILVDTAPTADGERIEAQGLGADGSLRWGPTPLASAQVRFLWVGSVGTAEGVLVFWAQKARDRKREEPAEIVVAALDDKGEIKGAPQIAVRDACAWQAVKSAAGAALASVRAHKQRCDTGSVELLRLNGLGKPQGAATVVSAEPTAEADLDLTRVGDRSLLAWSQRALEHRVYAAAVDDGGRVVVAPGPAVPARGDQAVIALVPPHSSGKSAFVVWEDLAERPLSGRILQIAPIGGEARANGKRARLEYGAVDGRMPEFQATARGAAALTLAPICSRGSACTGENRPTFVEFDEQMRVTASEPLNIGAREAKSVDLGWGLTCGKTSCFALSALGKSPTPLYVIELERRSDYYRPAATEITPGPAPRIVESEALAASDPLAQIAVAELAGQRMIGFITDFDPTTPWQKLKTPAADGRLEPLRARIGLQPRAANETGAALTPVVDLSLRAHSLGGVSISPAEAGKGEALVGWAGLDNGVPQVFLTTINKLGARVNQRMLTRKPGDVSDISLAFVGDGWMVGWVDERHEDAEVYVAKVNRALVRVGNEQRITNASGAAADLTLSLLGTSVLAVWTDARDTQTPGTADVHAALLSAKDGSRLKELRLLATRSHSFAPALRAFGTGMLVAWLEAKTEESAAGVYVGVVDDQAKWQTQPFLVPIEEGSPTALAVDCNASVCRALVTVDLGGPTELRGFTIKPGTPMRAARLTTLGGASAASVAPVLLGDVAYYADLNASRQGRLRRARIEWE